MNYFLEVPLLAGCGASGRLSCWFHAAIRGARRRWRIATSKAAGVYQGTC
jgi:hypothetical protein